MTVALEATGLGRRFGKRWALQDCTFELPAGSIAGLVGPNGAGKTTLLHIAVGLLEQTNGSISILGEHPGSERVLSRVGFVAQDTPLYKYFSVDDMISFGEHMNSSFDITFVHERMSRLEIPLDQSAGSLSGGQRAQVGLALALAKRPEILLLDEPLASLDPLARREFLKTLMEGVADTGVTVVLSCVRSHDGARAWAVPPHRRHERHPKEPQAAHRTARARRHDLGCRTGLA